MSEYPTYEMPLSKEAPVIVPYEELARDKWEQMAIAAFYIINRNSIYYIT